MNSRIKVVDFSTDIQKKEAPPGKVMENFYSDSAPNQMVSETGVKVIKVPTGVYRILGVNSYIQMKDYIIDQITKTA